MKEIDAGRVAGTFIEIPYSNFIQSPIGLVPKSGGKTLMIFHLSYNFSDDQRDGSLNAWTLREMCTVWYNDLDAAVRECLLLLKEAESMINAVTDQDSTKPILHLGKTDLTNAFRVLPLKVRCFCWLVFKAEDPSDGKIKYFVDKCLPFGASISCALYQKFSDSLKHIMVWRTGGTTGKAINNYLDDFLFIALLKSWCDSMINNFLKLCSETNIPVAIEKTEWSMTLIIYLGILLNGTTYTMSIPLNKQEKALKLLNDLTGKKKATVKDLQILTGYLNFLTKAIVSGRTFTRRMYAKYSQIQNIKLKNGKGLKLYHHVKLDQEFHFDCEIWHIFLHNSRNKVVCHPMIDLSVTRTATQLMFYSDASANPLLGVGAYFNKHWLFAKWEPGYIVKNKPSIEYLKLFGITAALLTWGHKIQNQRIIIFCDNTAVVAMINNCASSCCNCRYLLRLMMLDNLGNN